MASCLDGGRRMDREKVGRRFQHNRIHARVDRPLIALQATECLTLGQAVFGSRLGGDFRKIVDHCGQLETGMFVNHPGNHPPAPALADAGNANAPIRHIPSNLIGRNDRKHSGRRHTADGC